MATLFLQIELCAEPGVERKPGDMDVNDNRLLEVADTSKQVRR